MSGVIGLDIGGVNTKAVWRDGDAVRAVLRPYDVVRDPGALTAVIRDVMREALTDPSLPTDRKQSLLDSLLEGKVREATTTLVREVVLHPRGRTVDRGLEALGTAS